MLYTERPAPHTEPHRVEGAYLRKGIKIAGVVMAVLAIAVLVRVVYLLVDLDFFRSVERRFAGRCVTHLGAEGSEDVAIDHANATAYVSAADRQGITSGEQNGIYRLDLHNAPDASAELRRLTLSGLETLRPHGIDLWRLDDGSLRLFVVHHAEAGSRVELFDIADGTLVHVASVEDPLIFAPNDVAAVGATSFYVTNDQPDPETEPEDIWDELWGIFWGVEPSSVVFWDGTAARVVADDLVRANGIDTSPAGDELYVAESLGKAVRIYTRNGDDSLRLEDTVSLRGAPDNLAVAPDGAIYVGSQASIRGIMRGFMTKDLSRVPSEVTRITRTGGELRAEDLYLDPGTEISFLTSATPFGGDKFVLGAAFGNRVVVCEED